MRRSALLVLASVGSSNASVGSSTTPPPCDYGTGVMKWEAEPRHVFVVPCSQDPTQRWSGAALTAGAKVPSSVLSNAGAPADTRCLGSKERDPIGMVPCADAPHFIYNHSNKSLAIADGTGRCVDVNHGSGTPSFAVPVRRANFLMRDNLQVDWWPCAPKVHLGFKSIRVAAG